MQIALNRPAVGITHRHYDVTKRLLDVTLCTLALPFVLVFLGVCAAGMLRDLHRPWSRLSVHGPPIT